MRSLLLLVPLVAGCGIVDAATATTVVGGLLVATPDVSVAQQIDLSSEVVATAWVGERDSPTSTEAPEPIEGAAVQVSIQGANVALPDVGGGRYATTSVMAPGLVYTPGASYAFVAEANGARYGGTLPAAPTRLSPAALVLDPAPTAAHPDVPEALLHPADTKLTVRFPEQYGRFGYVTVLRANPNDATDPELVFDNRPDTAQEILDLVVGNPSRTVEIPATAFAQDGIYAIIVVALERGADLLPNTFIGSPILVGSGAAVVVGVDRGA